MAIEAVPLLPFMAKESVGYCFQRIFEGPHLR
jgi:hypothetical protein